MNIRGDKGFIYESQEVRLEDYIKELSSEEDGVRITIVIAVRNMASTVERAIESVLNQTYKNSELIVMDACSTDGTVEIIRKYEKCLAYWVSAPDKGPSDAIDKALQHTTGTLIGFLGADDWYEPYALELAARTYERTHADLCFGNMMTREGDIGEFKNLKNLKPDSLYVKGTQWLGAVNAFVKKELLWRNYRKWNDVLLTDYLFFLRLYAEGATFAHIDDERHITNFTIGGRTSSQLYMAHRDSQIVRMQILKEYPNMQEEYAPYADQLARAYAMGVAGYYAQVLSSEQCQTVIPKIPFHEMECILFGYGRQGKACARLLLSAGIRIKCIVDNDSEKWGGEINGVRVCKPETIMRESGKCIIVTPSFDYEEAIKAQIHEMHLDEKNEIISYSDVALVFCEAFGTEILDDAFEKGLII